ncbi:MAG: hypothetical protein AAF702_09385 [Chloroflexota bacterium]
MKAYIRIFAVSILAALLLTISLFNKGREVKAQDGEEVVKEPIVFMTINTGNVFKPESTPANNHELYNRIIADNKLPIQSRQADTADEGKSQDPVGQGVKSKTDDHGQGINLYESSDACLTFDEHLHWASHSASPSNIWQDSYAGWGAFAVNDGGFYKSDNVVFAIEQVIGPGKKSGSGEYSVKISSNQPYAAGYGSPMLSIPPGSEVIVSVKYMIYDHDVQGQDYDWVSLGLKSDATGEVAEYVNGYIRGQWAELSHTITAGETGQIMVLIQAHAPVALNSNVYFDDISIVVDGVPREECIFEG